MLASTLTLLASCGRAQEGPQAPAARSDTPRTFGYTVGDRITRRIALQAPPDQRLDERSLPRPGGQGRALELQSVRLHRNLVGVPETLQLDYQVFSAPAQPKVLELPALELRFTGGASPQTWRVDAWPVIISPLTPADAPTREGLGEWRPDLPPPAIATEPLRDRLMVEATLAALALAYLAQVYWLGPWLGRRNRPFEQAWAVLRRLPDQPDEAQRRAAMACLHTAMNASAGEAVFASQVAHFVSQRPMLAALQPQIQRFFEASDAEFFGAQTKPLEGAWLREFSRACRDAERGVA